MMETMVLMGAEELSRAMYSLREVAEKMQQAAGSYEFAVQQNQRFMDDWLQRFEEAIKGAKP
jgi:hypothetical protein